MADNVTLPGTGEVIAGDDIAGAIFQRVKMVLGADGVNDGDVSSANPVPVTGPLTDAQLRAAVVPVNQSGVSATGSLNVLNAAVALSLNGASGWAVDLRGTFSATITFQGTIDGTNWFPIAIVPAGGSVNATTVTTATAAGQWWGNATGLQQVRAIATAYTSGAATVVIRAMQAAGIVTALISGAGTVPVSGTVTATVASTTVTSVSAGSNLIGDVGMQYRATATGAGSVANLNCPATPAVQSIKGTAGRLMGLYLVNTNATIRWLKVFNIAAPTLASSAAILRIPLPQNQPVYFNFEGGMGFSTAITCAICSTASLTDATGAVTVDDVTGFAVFA
jgi:hypothetical protein